VNVDELADEAERLMRMEIDQLYAILGAQMLGQAAASRVAGIVSYLAAMRNASQAKSFYDVLSAESFLTELGKGTVLIYEDLKREGMQHFSEASEDLRKTLCTNRDILKLADEESQSVIGILITVVSAALRLPRKVESVSVTITAILCKIGLRNFCSNADCSLKLA
jgi:hypothetical protein